MSASQINSSQSNAGREEMYRMLVENSHDIIYTLTADGVFTFVSPAWSALVGHPVEEVVGQSFQPFVHPDDIPVCMTWLQKVIESGQRQEGVEYRVRHTNGTWKWHTSSATPLKDASGAINGFYGIARDITSQKETQIAEKEFSAALAESTPAFLVTLNSDGTVRFMNQFMLAALGYSLDEVIGKDYIPLAAREDESAILMDAFRQTTQLREITLNDTHIVARDGHQILVEWRGKPILKSDGTFDYFLGLGLDVTGQKAAEIEVQHLASFIETANEAILSASVKGEVLSWNPAAERMFGYKREEIIGKSVIILSPMELREQSAGILKRLQSGENLPPTETKRVAKNGDIIDVLLSATPVKNSAGQMTSFSVVMSDITERNRTEEKTKESQRRLSLLVESSPMAIIEWNLNFEVVSWNPAAEQVFGYTAAEAMGKHARFIIPPEYHGLVDQVWQGLLAQTGGERSTNANTTKDGRVITCEWYNTPLVGEDGKVIGASSLVQDVTEQKQAEARLKQNETDLSSALRVAQMGYWEFDIPSQMFTFNDQYYSLLGIDARQIGGYQIGAQEFAQKYVHPDDAAIVGYSIQQAMEATDPNFQMQNESRNLRADGSVMWAAIWFRIEKDEQGRTTKLYGVTQNITKRKTTEEEMLQQSEKFRMVADFTYDWEYWLGTDNKYIYLSPSVKRITGYEVNAFMQNPDLFSEIVHPDDKKTFEGHIHDFHAEHSDAAGEVEVRIVTPDGKERWLSHLCQPVYDANGQWMGRRGSNRDITENKEAEEEMRRFQLMVQNSTDFINMSDMEGKMLFLNETGRKMVGVEDKDISNLVIFNIIPEDYLPVVQAQTLPALMEKGEWSGELRYRNVKTGNIIEVYASTYMLRDPKTNEPRYLVNISRDITENKRLELEVQQAFERRGYQVQISTEISQEIATASELPDLFARVVTLTKERLGYYHTQLLRYDAAQDAVALINGYGETGAKMLADGHKLPMGKGLIGTAAASGETVMRPNLADDPDWQPNPLLPETKGEIAVPIKLGDQILGVLDVQSSQAGALTEDDRLLLEGLCGQIAVAIHSTELLEELRDSRERYELSVAGSNDGLWDWDMSTNDVYFSPRWKEMIGYGEDELNNGFADFESLLHPEDHDYVMGHVNDYLTGKIPSYDMEFRFRHKDGSHRWILARGMMVRNAEGIPMRMAGSHTDITERRKTQEDMAERLEEVNRLYRAMSREGWKTYRETADIPEGFLFDQSGIKAIEEASMSDKPFANIPMKVLGGEIVGSLAVADDPQRPMSKEDLAFLQQVSDQVALALEGARLTAQTQSALAQTEKLSEAGLLFTRASDLQELVKIAAETLGIPQINRAILETFNYSADNEVDSMDIVANWWSGTGTEPTAVGARYSTQSLPMLQLFVTPTPIFIKDTMADERIDPISMQVVQKLNVRAVAVLPLFLAEKQLGVMLLEAENNHEFTQEQMRLFSAMGPQISTVLENRRQFERARQQAEREGMLNIISQKIQSATTVEAVLQIAARELGHALGAPMTIAQLSMKDRK